MRRLLMAWSARLPCRLIQEDGQPYLERYYVGSPFGLRVYLHRFVASDPDRGLHDHPWQWALSVILAGWYFEERRDTLNGTPRLVRWLNWLRGDTFHRVLLPRDFCGRLSHEDRLTEEEMAVLPPDCWSLFVHRVGHAKRWGFLKPLPDTDDAAVFMPVSYPGGSSRSGEWWQSAPLGREVRTSAEAAARANVYPVSTANGGNPAP